MNRKVKYAFRLAFNLLRFSVARVISLGKITSGCKQLISPACRINAEKGHINFCGCLVAEPNVYIHAVSGEIIVQDAFINRNSMIVAMEKIEISSGVTIGPNVCIYDHDHDLHNKCGYSTASVKIEKKCMDWCRLYHSQRRYNRRRSRCCSRGGGNKKSRAIFYCSWSTSVKNSGFEVIDLSLYMLTAS